MQCWAEGDNRQTDTFGLYETETIRVGQPRECELFVPKLTQSRDKLPACSYVDTEEPMGDSLHSGPINVTFPHRANQRAV